MKLSLILDHTCFAMLLVILYKSTANFASTLHATDVWNFITFFFVVQTVYSMKKLAISNDVTLH